MAVSVLEVIDTTFLVLVLVTCVAIGMLSGVFVDTGIKRRLRQSVCDARAESVDEIARLQYALDRATELREQAEAMHDERVREREFYRASLKRRAGGLWTDFAVDTMVCMRAWGTRGRDEQLAQLAEECAELGAAANHLRRGKVRPEQVAGEIADVLIQIGQVTIMEIGVDLVRSAVVDTQARIVEGLHHRVGLPPLEPKPSCSNCGGARYLPRYIGLANTNPVEYVRDGTFPCSTCNEASA